MNTYFTRSALLHPITHPKPGWRWVFAGVGVVALYILFLWGPGRLPWTFAQNTAIYRPGIKLPSDAPVTGRGVPFGHVEGSFGDYVPNMNAAAFDGVKMTARSGQSKVNGHAQSTARIIYGPAGLAPGVQDVSFYTTSHWMGSGVLRAGTRLPPITAGRRVFTHSWISNSSVYAVNILSRVDYLIDEHDVMMAVGVNNGADTPVPALLGSAYNVVAVGVAHGNSSGGYTRIEGVGRCKPDIVAVRRTTSAATPVVAGTIAKLFEAADRMQDVPSAGKSEVIKAVLMAGAVKTSTWHSKPGKPLDEHLGAGVVHFEESYAILRSGKSSPDQAMKNYGWDFTALPRGGRNTYRFSLTGPMDRVSVMLVWHRRIDGRVVEDLFSNQERWLALSRKADFDLRLVREGGGGETQVVAQSVSKIDNVEHVYLHKLSPGDYQLEVSRHDSLGEDWDYAIAWRMAPRPGSARR